MQDYYQILGVARDATQPEIKKAFRGLARELHPDVNKHDPQAEEKFKQAAEAYEVLSDSERRQIYDRYGRDGLRSGGFQSRFTSFTDMSEIFDAFFGGDPFGGIFGRTAGTPRAARGGDIGIAVEISLADSARGLSREVEFEAVDICEACKGNGAQPGTPIVSCANCQGTGQLRMVTDTALGRIVRSSVCDRCGGEGKVAEQRCEQCGGKGRSLVMRKLSVEIPAGIADGQRIRISDRGHAGERGGLAGDLYLQVNIKHDERFARDGDDLVTYVQVTMHEAALGTVITVPTLEGEQEIELKPGTQPGQVEVLNRMGFPSLEGRGRGNQRVHIDVVIPHKLNEEQRELLKRFSQSVDSSTYKGAKSTYQRLKDAFK